MADAAESTKEATGAGAKVTTVVASEHATVDAPAEPGTGFDDELSQLYAHIVAGDRPAHDKITDTVKALGLADGAVVVSLGDGTGEPGVRIARELPAVKVVSADASEAMTAQAATYGQGLENLATVTVSADADELAERCGVAGEASVDVVILSFSLMFVPDKAKCLASVKKLLKPDGCVIIAVLSKFGLLPCVGAGMTAVLGESPPTPPLNPLSLANAAVLDALVADAGLGTIVSDEGMAYPFPLGPNLDVTRRLSALPVKEQLAEMRTKNPDAMDVYVRAFMEECEGRGWVADGRCVVPAKECCPRVLVVKQSTSTSTQI